MFQKLSLKISKFKDSSYTARLRFACTSRAFLMVVTDFYKYGSLNFHIRQQGPFNEEILRVIGKKLLKEIEKYHKERRIVLDMRSDNVFIDDNGHPRIQLYTSSKFHAYNIAKGKIETDITYLCKLVDLRNSNHFSPRNGSRYRTHPSP